MDQGSDLPVKTHELKPLSVLRGGKKEPAVEAAGSSAEKAQNNKGSGDTSEGQAKVSSLIHGLAQHMVKKTPDLPEFPHKLHVMRDEEGLRYILEETGNSEVARISNDVVALYILKFIKDSGFPLGMSKIVAKDMKNIITEFTAIAPRCEDPAIVCQLSEPGLTYRKLPFDFEQDLELERSPTFKEMIARTTNGRALMAWIGSLFDPDADMQQYVWIFGGGQNGKSSLGRFLSAVLGNGARSVQPPGLNDRFWTINLIGKRLVIYGDCNNSRFVTSGLFKSMTGGDAVPAEIKLGASLQVVLKGKHLFFSNKKPGIDGGEADQRRIILCEMAAIEGSPDPFYEDRLWEEAPTFLGQCINVYCDDAGPRRRIPCDQTAARELALENDEDLEIIFTSYFVLKPGSVVTGLRMREIMHSTRLTSTNDIRRFREFMEAQYGIKKVKNSAGVREYRGIAESAVYFQGNLAPLD